MTSVLVAAILENGAISDLTWELAVLSRELVGGDGAVALALQGSGLAEAASTATDWFDEVITFDDPSLDVPDGERFAAIVAGLVQREGYDVVLMSHSNFAMDSAPRLSVSLDRPLISDCLSVEVAGGDLVCVRSMYAGKLHAEMVAALVPNGCIVTLRPGSLDVPNDPPGRQGTTRNEAVPQETRLSRRYVRTVEPDAEDVDISQARILVAVGRGIEDGENMELIEQLAEALSAEIACSRPVVDSNWLPKTRQVGTSGVTVRPQIYLAVGISGSFQHMGGVKGSPFIAAINSDPRAPIFNEADVGIVGDLFDVVPVLTEKIRSARS